jgi:transcriptional regulator with XRE-family HTH domain
MIKMNASLFWQRVRNEVDSQNTSFEWLYQKSKIAKGTFSSWRNRNSYPRADAAFRIAQALGVSLEYLMTGLDKAPEKVHPDIREIFETIAVVDEPDLKSVKALVKTMALRYNRVAGAFDRQPP